MPNRIRRVIAGLTIAAATTAGLALTTTPAAAAVDTSLSTPATTADTHWGLTPIDTDIAVTTQDTYWG
jgi:hypothetical protein